MSRRKIGKGSRNGPRAVVSPKAVLSFSEQFAQELLDFFSRCTDGEKLAAVLLWTVVSTDTGLGNEILSSLQANVRRGVGEDPDADYLVGMVQGMEIAAAG